MWLPGSLPFATIPLYSCSFMYIYVSIFIPYAVANKFFPGSIVTVPRGVQI